MTAVGVFLTVRYMYLLIGWSCIVDNMLITIGRYAYTGNSTTSRFTNNNLINVFSFILKDMMSMWRCCHKCGRHQDEDACMSREELNNHVYRLICSHEQKWSFRIRTIYHIRGTLSSCTYSLVMSDFMCGMVFCHFAGPYRTWGVVLWLSNFYPPLLTFCITCTLIIPATHGASI